MSRKDFHQLLQRYLEGDCSLAERQMVEQWYEMLDLHPQTGLDAHTQDLSEARLMEIEREMWDRIQLKAGSRMGRAFIKPWMRYAAIALLVSAGAAFFILNSQQPVAPDAFTSGWNHIKSNAQSQSVLLEDGSLVRLEAHSEISVPRHFASGSRSVYLNGSAFFEVSHNLHRPFLVINKSLIVKVLGTSFQVSEKPGNGTTVAVRTGKVLVTPRNEKTSPLLQVIQMGRQQGLTPLAQRDVLLTPNEKTTWETSQKSFETGLVPVPLPVPLAFPVSHAGEASEKSLTRFEDAPLKDVIASLENTYKVKISIPDAYAGQTFTGDITEENLYARLDLVCQSLHLKYQTEGTVIRLIALR